NSQRRVTATHRHRPFRSHLRWVDSQTMFDGDLRVVVDRDNIIITQPGCDFVAVYFKPRSQPYLVAKDTPVCTQGFQNAGIANGHCKSPRAWVDRINSLGSSDPPLS